MPLLEVYSPAVGLRWWIRWTVVIAVVVIVCCSLMPIGCTDTNGSTTASEPLMSARFIECFNRLSDKWTQSLVASELWVVWLMLLTPQVQVDTIVNKIHVPPPTISREANIGYSMSLWQPTACLCASAVQNKLNERSKWGFFDPQHSLWSRLMSCCRTGKLYSYIYSFSSFWVRIVFD